MLAAAGCGFAYYGHSVKPALALIVELDEARHPSPSAKLIGEALVKELLPQWWSVLSMCLYQPDRMEYAPVLQGLVLHATWVLRDGVVLDIQPDYRDLTEEGIAMPPQSNAHSAGAAHGLHRPICIGTLRGPIFRPYGGQPGLGGPLLCCLPHLLWCLMLPLLLCYQMIVMVTPHSRCVKLFLI